MFLTGISDFQAFNDVIADVISYDPFVVTPLFNKQLFSSLDLCRCFPTEISNFEAFNDFFDDVISHDCFATPLFNEQLWTTGPVWMFCFFNYYYFP